LAGNNIFLYLIEYFNSNSNSIIFTESIFISFVSTFITLSKNNRSIPLGPKILSIFLKEPVRLYNNPNLDRNLIGLENKKRSIIYQ